MPRRKSAVEVLPSEEINQPMREVKHKTEWVELRPVEEGAEDGERELFDDDVIEEKPKRRVNSERDELRKKLAKSNITPGSQLKLTIERYTHSDVVDSQGGMFAETEHCNKYVCAESHITSEDYLDVARKFGPGLYRFTLRMKNQIVTAWDKRISGGAATPVVQHVNPNDPTSPQFIVQMPEGAQQPVSVVDPLKQMREAAKFYKEMKQTFEPEGMQQQQQPKSEEEVLTTAILNRPEVVDNLVGSVMKRIGGSSGKDDEPWYADVVRDAVKSGQLVQVVQVAIDRIFNGVGNLFPGRQNQNGQAQMAETQFPQGQQAGGPIPDPTTRPQALESNQQGSEATTEFSSQSEVPNQAGHQQITPEDQTLAIVLNNCSRKVPPQITADQVLKYADLLNDQAPQYSIDGYLEMFAKMPIETALDFVKTQPNGEQIANLEWAKDYTEQLQKLIRESLQEGEA